MTKHVIIVLALSAATGLAGETPFPKLLDELYLGASRSNVVSLVRQHGYSTRDANNENWHIVERMEVVEGTVALPASVRALLLGFKDDALVDVSVTPDPAVLPKSDADRLYQAWVRERTDLSGEPFVATTVGSHDQQCWVTSNATYKVTKFWRTRLSEEAEHSMIGKWMESLATDQLEDRKRLIAADLQFLPASGPGLVIRWSPEATPYRSETNNPLIREKQEAHKRDIALSLDAQKGISRRPSGPLGSEMNPVRCEGPAGERAYLGRLRAQNGLPVSFHCTGRYCLGPYSNAVNRYVVQDHGSRDVIFTDMFHTNYVETNAVPGFTLVGE